MGFTSVLLWWGSLLYCSGGVHFCIALVGFTSVLLWWGSLLYCSGGVHFCTALVGFTSVLLRGTHSTPLCLIVGEGRIIRRVDIFLDFHEMEGW